ncbi:MAG: alpha/beta hydrolase family protein [Caulobacteraceae bacterium]
MKLGAAFIAAAAVMACGMAHAAPLEAYGKLPTMDMVTISPDGSKVAFVQVVDGRQAVVVDQLNPAAVIGQMPPTEQKVRELRWADNTHLIVTKSYSGFAQGLVGGKSEWWIAYNFDVAKKKVEALFDKDPDVGPNSRIRGTRMLRSIYGLSIRMVDGHPTALADGVVYVDSTGAYALLSSDLITGSAHIVESALDPNQERHWYFDDKGSAVAQATYDQKTHNWFLRLKRERDWVQVYSVKALIETPEVLGFTADGTSLLLRVVKTDGDTETKALSLADGKLGPAERDYEAYSSLIEDPVTHRVIGGIKIAIEPTYDFFDPKDQATWDAVGKVFPNEQVDLVSWSNDRSKMVIKVTGPLHGVLLAVVDLASHKATPIGQTYAGITPDDVADVSIASYRATDGTKIDAFLTLPTGREPKNLPLIVLPHGGPASRDAAGFDWWAQALASRGYAVLQPQFRGSGDLGWRLESAGFGEWGRKMQSDLSDGVKALAAAGMIDPKRVCIVGGSYGGYAALAGVTLEQGVYRCAVSYAGVSDLHRMIGGVWSAWVDADKSSGARYLDRFVGAKEPTDPVFDKVSPIRHLAELNAPVLLIHGKEDTVVPYEQSVLMESAMKGAGKSVEFLTLPGEDHWLSHDATRQQMLQATVTFLEKNNPPK